MRLASYVPVSEHMLFSFITSLAVVLNHNITLGCSSYLQYQSGGDVEHYVYAQKNGYLPEPKSRDYFRQIISGMSWLTCGTSVLCVSLNQYLGYARDISVVLPSSLFSGRS